MTHIGQKQALGGVGLLRQLTLQNTAPLILCLAAKMFVESALQISKDLGQTINLIHGLGLERRPCLARTQARLQTVGMLQSLTQRPRKEIADLHKHRCERYKNNQEVSPQ